MGIRVAIQVLKERSTKPVVAQVPVALGTDEAALRPAARQRLESYAKSPFYAAMFATAGLLKDGAGAM